MDTELKEPRQITSTPEEEKEPVWSSDGNSILYIKDGGNSADIFKASRADKSKLWWLNNKFNHEQITKDAEPKEDLTLSPDGKSIAYSRLRGDLYISDISGANPRKIISSWNPIGYDWAPDSKWLVYSQYDSDFNRDIFILPIDLSALHSTFRGIPIMNPTPYGRPMAKQSHSPESAAVGMKSTFIMFTSIRKMMKFTPAIASLTKRSRKLKKRDLKPSHLMMLRNKLLAIRRRKLYPQG